MLKNFLDALKKSANRTFTENGAVTLRSSGADVLDLFAVIGALRNADNEEIIHRFVKAWAEDRNLAMKVLFYGRDIRGGIGERRTFRVILRWLAEYEPESVRKNLSFIPEYGRWDDLMVLMGTPCEQDALALIKDQLTADLSAMEKDEPVSLLAKWLPSVNASSNEVRHQGVALARNLGFSTADYRKKLSALRAKIRIIENNLREKDYTFDYSQQPSKAMFKYRKAFIRNDNARYESFLGMVEKGEGTLHTGSLMPYELVNKVQRGISDPERNALNVTWNALEDFTDGRNALAVVDVSQSMTCGKDPRPIDVAVSLGLYFAERNKGPFRNYFITFSADPVLVEIKGTDLADKVRYIMNSAWSMNTDIQKVFELVLRTAISNRMKQEDLPETIYIISDMEFDSCAKGADLTNFEYAQKLYEANGYRLPSLVFWNVNSRNEQQPVRMNDRGVALVSGASARVFQMAMSNDLDPWHFMMSVINSERYAPIHA